MNKRIVKVAAIQMKCSEHVNTNILRAEQMIRDAASQGAQIILLQELFASLYFCQEENNIHFDLAEDIETSAMLSRFQTLAKELNVVLPISFFEKSNNAYYNSIVIFDADGQNLGLYRKSHIPDGPGYEEKYYFTPGDTGFQVWDTKFAKIGVAICWDQWFTEPARIMALEGAQILFYPTAIGSEPSNAEEDSKDRWQKCMIGHSIANVVAVVASNRVGVEIFGNSEITFYGSSFVANHKGEFLATADRSSEEIVVADIDLNAIQNDRHDWPFFRDRRPDLYSTILTKDGKSRK